MSKEEGTPTKRATRSSASTAPQKPPRVAVGSLKPCSTLSFSERPITDDDLHASLPGRRDQVDEILELIGPVDSPMFPLLVYGTASTGKTRTVLQTFRHLNRPFIYVSCRSCHSPRILFESVLNQLLCHRRSSENNYTSVKRCERPAEFIHFLREALSNRRIEKDKERLIKSGGKECRNRTNGKKVYLILDNLELIRQWGKNSSLLSLLFRIHDIMRVPDLGFIYITNEGPDAYYSYSGSTEYATVFFPNYTEDELHQVLIRNQFNPKLYSCFLKVVLSPFFRITRRLDELSMALKPLFQRYCEPLADLNIDPDESMKRRLYNSLQPHIASSMDNIFKIVSRSSVDGGKDVSVARKRNVRKAGWGEVYEELDFHMSVSAKYLLISAFLTSRNPATLDAAMFDSRGGPGNQKRKRKNSETSIQQKDMKAQEMLMKGPGSFSLERLLAIFQCITSVSDDIFEEEVLGDRPACKNMEIGLMSDVLLQFSTLCNANFISKGGSCPLECSTRYRCSVDEEMALKVARSINFPLSKYLLRR